VKCVGDEVVQPRGWGGRGWCRGRGDVRARKEVGDEASTELRCGLVSMKRVASTRALQQPREKVLGLKFGKALTDVGPWAVVVAEGLEIFWAFRKGEGCLAGTRPDTAAIIGWREEGGDRYRWMKKKWGTEL